MPATDSKTNRRDQVLLHWWFSDQGLHCSLFDALIPSLLQFKSWLASISHVPTLCNLYKARLNSPLYEECTRIRSHIREPSLGHFQVYIVCLGWKFFQFSWWGSSRSLINGMDCGGPWVPTPPNPSQLVDGSWCIPCSGWCSVLRTWDAASLKWNVPPVQSSLNHLKIFVYIGV